MQKVEGSSPFIRLATGLSVAATTVVRPAEAGSRAPQPSGTYRLNARALDGGLESRSLTALPAEPMMRPL